MDCLMCDVIMGVGFSLILTVSVLAVLGVIAVCSIILVRLVMWLYDSLFVVPVEEYEE